MTSGAGAAALACLDLLVSLGARRENIWLTDIEGVVYEGRAGADGPLEERYAQKTDKRTLAEVIAGADIFLGLSAPRRAQAGDGGADGAAAADPGARQSDAGDHAGGGARRRAPTRSSAPAARDYPNQVNNVLCFPFIFRGALDVGATDDQRGDEDRRRSMPSPRSRARRPSEVAARAYGGEAPTFGPGSLIPNPFDPAADPAHRAGGRRGGDGIGRRRPGRSPISTPIASGSTHSCSAPASS